MPTKDEIDALKVENQYSALRARVPHLETIEELRIFNRSVISAIAKGTLGTTRATALLSAIKEHRFILKDAAAQAGDRLREMSDEEFEREIEKAGLRLVVGE